MLEIWQRNGMCEPHIVCDHCGVEIKTEEEGNVEFPFGTEISGVFFVHKACSHEAELIAGIGRRGWMPIGATIYYLIHNLKVDMKRAKSSANLMANII